MHRRLRRLIVALAAAVVLLIAAVLTSPWDSVPSPPAERVGPKAIYLALGDSIVEGGAPGVPTAGYVFTFAATMPNTRLIDYGCSGESSTTFIEGHCPYPNGSFTGTQLEAALAVIRANPGAVSPVTLGLGANDLFSVTGLGCGVEQRATSMLNTYESNMRSIIERILTALNGTGDVVVLNTYHPYQNVCSGYPRSRQVFRELNARLASVAASYDVAVVDVYATFGNNRPPPNPLVCEYTFLCDRNDVHPTKAGHDAIATALRARLGPPY